MRGNELLDSMELVDAAYIEAADAAPKKKTWLRWTAMAASLCLIVGAVFGFGLLKDPGVEPDVEPDIAYYALSDLLSRDDFASIIWGKGSAEDDIPTVDDPELSGGENKDPQPDISVPVPDDEIWAEWNGIKISVALRDMLQDLREDDLIAIGVESWVDPALLYDDYVKLDDYIFNGKTYSEIRTEYTQAQELFDALRFLKEYSSYYEDIPDGDYETFWRKLYDNVGEETVRKYFQGTGKDDGKFDTTAISDDLNACETEILQLSNAMAACRRAYAAKYSTVPDLSKMMNKGYYVVGNEGVFAVILPVGQLPQFAQAVREVYGEKVIDAVMFRMATQSELGVEVTPEGDVPIGEVEEEPNIPDDVTTEDIPVKDAET